MHFKREKLTEIGIKQEVMCIENWIQIVQQTTEPQD